MALLRKNMTCRITAGTCGLLLALLLVACGGGNTNTSSKSNSSSQVTNESSSTNNPTATSTTQASWPTKTYSGNGFTIEYPQSWKETASESGVAFTDPLGNYNMTIGVSSNIKENVSADKLADTGITEAKLDLKNVETLNVPQTTTLAGQTWSQRSFTGTNLYKGQNIPVEASVLATNYPAHNSGNKGYVIAYVALKNSFSQAKNTYFIPMLQSFKFTA